MTEPGPSRPYPSRIPPEEQTQPGPYRHPDDSRVQPHPNPRQPEKDANDNPRRIL